LAGQTSARADEVFNAYLLGCFCVTELEPRVSFDNEVIPFDLAGVDERGKKQCSHALRVRRRHEHGVGIDRVWLT
jgi:hypothetical protein